MSELLQQAVIAIKTGNPQRAGQLLGQILQTDPDNITALVWLSRIAGSEEKRRACLDRALTLNSDHPEVRQAWLEWVLATAPPATPAAPPEPPPVSTRVAGPHVSPFTPPMVGTAGASLQEFLLQLTKNYNLLKEREAKYGSTAAPLDLLNQLEDYERAIALTKAAIERAAPLDELQAEFGSLNLQISTVVFVAQEPPRKPFKGLNPYRGLLKFTEDDAQFFFGRTAAIQSLLNTIQYLVETGTTRQVPDLIAVLGPSGSGKSSLVRAGLIPALWAGRIEGSQQWPLKVMLPGAHPLDALAQVFEGKVGQELGAIRASLNGGEKALHELIVECLVLAKAPETAVFVLVIDQFEETFTLCEDELERRAFIDQILYAIQTRRNRAFIILTMRTDFYSKVAAYKSLAEVITLNQMLVSPMTEKELREAILLPAEAVGLELEKALVETLLKDTFEAPGVLPLLQHTLLELFQRREGNLLTLAAYQEIGGVKGALAHRADTILDSMPMAQRHIVRRILMRLVHPGDGTPDTRRRATFSEILPQGHQPEEVEALIQTLADANLIVTSRSQESGEMILDVTHEALIKEWPRFQSWLDWDRQGLRIRQQLAQATREWLARNRDEDSLYRGARLLEAEEWVAANPGEINPAEAEFMAASMTLRDAEATEKEAQRQRELAAAQQLATEAQAREQAEAERVVEAEARARDQEQAARSLRKRAVIMAGIGVIAIILAMMASLLFFRAREQTEIAEREQKLATSRELAATALTTLTRDPELSTLLAIQGVSIGDSSQAQSALRQALQSLNSQLTLTKMENLVGKVAFSPDGKRLVAADIAGTIQIWDAVSGQELLTLTGPEAQVNTLTFSQDGKRLAISSDDGTATVWDVVSGRELLTRTVPEAEVYPMAFSLDGKRLALSGDEQGTIKLWDVASDVELLTLTAYKGAIYSLAFSPDGKRLVTCDSDGRVKVWDASTGQELFALADQGWDVIFSHDGKRLGTASGGLVWDATSGQQLQTLVKDSGDVLAEAFSPDWQYLASGFYDGTIKVWDMESGRVVWASVGHKREVYDLAFSTDGNRLVTASDDGTAKVWDVASGRELLTLIEPLGSLDAVAFNSEGTHIATAASGTIRIWQANHPDVFAGFSAAFNTDGTRLATVSSNNLVKVWDVASGQELQTMIGPESPAHSIAFDPDLKSVAMDDGNRTIKVQEIASGQELLTFAAELTEVTPMTFSPDGKHLARAVSDTVKVWDAISGQELLTLPGHKAEIFALAFDLDGKRLATAEDGTVRVWNMVSGQELLTIPDPDTFLNYYILSAETIESSVGTLLATDNSIALSPDGNRLAIGSSDGTVKVWDAVSGQKLLTINAYPGQVWMVSFSPDGAFMATGEGDGIARVWDATSGEELMILSGHKGEVVTAQFSPDGTRLVTAGARDDTIRIHILDRDLLVQTAQSRLSRWWTPEECQKYLHQNTCPPKP